MSADLPRLAAAQAKADEVIAAVATPIDGRPMLRIEEWNLSTLDSKLRDQIKAVHDPVAGGDVIIVPAGQDPIARLAAVRELIEDMRGAA